MSGWQSRAACRDEPAFLWFPTEKWEEVEAIKICQTCPVIRECGEFAETSNQGHREVWGVWAGRLLEPKRLRAEQQRQRRQAASA